MKIEYKIEPPDGPDFGVFKYTYQDLGGGKVDHNDVKKELIWSSRLLTECEAYIRTFCKTSG